MAVMLGILSAIMCYDVAQLMHDWRRAHAHVYVPNNHEIQSQMSVFVMVSTLVMVARCVCPVIVQWLFVWGWHSNYRVQRGQTHAHKQRDWYQVGNVCFYVLSLVAACGFVLTCAFEKWRREEFGDEAVDRADMDRVIEEVRREVTGYGEHECEQDTDGMGLWLSVSMKSTLSALSRYPACKQKGLCIKHVWKRYVRRDYQPVVTEQL